MIRLATALLRKRDKISYARQNTCKCGSETFSYENDKRQFMAFCWVQVWQSCVWQSCVWQSGVSQCCVWMSSVWHKVVCDKNVCDKVACGRRRRKGEESIGEESSAKQSRAEESSTGVKRKTNSLTPWSWQKCTDGLPISCRLFWEWFMFCWGGDLE